MTISTLFLELFRVFFSVYVSNQISSEALGVFHLIMSIYVLGITFASSGIGFSCMRIVSEELAKNNILLAKKAAQKCIFFSFISGLFASIFLFLIANYIVDICFNNIINKNIIYLICIALPFTSLSSSINGYFSAIRKVYKSSLRSNN